MTPTDMAEALLQAVPFARTLRIGIVSVTPDESGGRNVTAVAELPDQEAVHNHVGGPHAGALFTLGETASGAVVLAAFADQLDRVVPLTVRAEIAYRKFAQGTVRAQARLDTPPDRVVAELEVGDRPELTVRVSLHTVPAGLHVAEMTVVWTLRPR